MTLQFISHVNDRYGYIDGIRMALQGGCRWIQLRVKNMPDDKVRPLAMEAINLCRAAGAVIIIDDRVELVRELGADGVHLGKNDMSVMQARKILGSEFIIGGTANRFEDVRNLYEQSADYIGCGPLRFTTTKEKLAPVLGYEGYADIVGRMRREDINIPIIAIGGIIIDDIPDLACCGVDGIAVSGAILNADDPIKITTAFMKAVGTPIL